MDSDVSKNIVINTQRMVTGEFFNVLYYPRLHTEISQRLLGVSISPETVDLIVLEELLHEYL